MATPLQLIPNRAGPGQATLGASSAVDSSEPVVLDMGLDSYMWTPESLDCGLSNAGIGVATSAFQRFYGDFVIDDFPAATSRLLSGYAGFWSVTGTTMQIIGRDTGNTIIYWQATYADLGVVEGVRYQMKVELDWVAEMVTWYKRPEAVDGDDITHADDWVLAYTSAAPFLYSPAVPGTGARAANSLSMLIASIGSGNSFRGRTYRMAIEDVSNGVWDLDVWLARDIEMGADPDAGQVEIVSARTGDTWDVVRPTTAGVLRTTIVTRPCWRFYVDAALDQQIQLPPNEVPDMIGVGLPGSVTVVALVRAWQAGNGHRIYHTGSVPNGGLSIIGTATNGVFQTRLGGTTTSASRNAITVPGALSVVAAVIDGETQEHRSYTSADGLSAAVSYSGIGDPAFFERGRVGLRAEADGSHWEGEFFALLQFPRALSETELDTLSGILLAGAYA